MRPGEPGLVSPPRGPARLWREHRGPEVEACAALAGLRDRQEPSLGPEAGVPPSVSARLPLG